VAKDRAIRGLGVTRREWKKPGIHRMSTGAAEGAPAFWFEGVSGHS